MNYKMKIWYNIAQHFDKSVSDYLFEESSEVKWRGKLGSVNESILLIKYN